MKNEVEAFLQFRGIEAFIMRHSSFFPFFSVSHYAQASVIRYSLFIIR